MENDVAVVPNQRVNHPSMGPCFRGMENIEIKYGALYYGEPSMGPCFRGMENLTSGNIPETGENPFNGAML